MHSSRKNGFSISKIKGREREKLILIARYKNKFYLYFKISLGINMKTMQLHISFVFNKVFHYFNFILLNLNYFLLTVAGWEK